MRAVDRWFSCDRDTWPHRGAIYREYPQRFRLARMQYQQKANVANFPGHVCAEPMPAVMTAFKSVDGAAILLEYHFPGSGMYAQAVRIVTLLRIRIRQKISGAVLIQRFPGFACIGTFKDAATGHSHIEMVFVERVDVDRR